MTKRGQKLADMYKEKLDRELYLYRNGFRTGFDAFRVSVDEKHDEFLDMVHGMYMYDMIVQTDHFKLSDFGTTYYLETLKRGSEWLDLKTEGI